MLLAAGTEWRNTRRIVATQSAPALPPRSAAAQPGYAWRAAMQGASYSTGIPRENGSPATQPAVIVDHAETADQPNVRVVDRITQRRSRQLTNGVGQSEE